jgi:chromate transporter
MMSNKVSASSMKSGSQKSGSPVISSADDRYNQVTNDRTSGLQTSGLPNSGLPNSGLPNSGLPSSNLKSPDLYRKLFTTFFKIGAFTLGGGYAMIPTIQSEVVEKNGWVKEEDFVDLVAIAQSCPGTFAANIATFIGYKVNGTKGALCTTLGTVLPSFIIILLIAMVFRQFMQIHWIAAMFNGIRPAVVALIAVPTFNLAKSAKVNLGNVWIPIASAILICALGVNPIWIIIAAGLGGFLYGRIKDTL